MTELEIAIRLSRMKGIGASVFRKLIDEFVLPSKALAFWLEQSADVREKLKVSQRKNPNEVFIENTLKKLNSREYFGSFYSQKDYPEQFNALSEPPPVVYTANKFKQCRYAAVVGSRKATEGQLILARKKTLELIEDGYAIVSGGALGVDNMALRTALERGASPLAILGNGLDVVYPKENKELFCEILKKGNLLSELMFGAQPQRGFFPTRNRLIAAMADVVIVIASSPKSGSLQTAKWAQKIGKKKVLIFSA